MNKRANLQAFFVLAARWIRRLLRRLTAPARAHSWLVADRRCRMSSSVDLYNNVYSDFGERR